MTSKEKQQAEQKSISATVTYWLGTPLSILLHTIFFASMFSLVLFGWELQDMLLALTTALSIEAIYLALFIQMSVNRTTESLEEVEESLEDVEEDIDTIEKDIDAIQLDERNDDKYDEEVAETLKTIENRLARLQEDLDVLRKKGIM